MTREEFVAGLRDMADFFEANPEMPRPSSAVPINVFLPDRKALKELTRLIGTAEKGANADYFWLRKSFAGELAVDFNVTREEVCKRVVTGTRVVPEHVEEIVEWECEPIMEQETA